MFSCCLMIGSNRETQGYSRNAFLIPLKCVFSVYPTSSSSQHNVLQQGSSTDSIDKESTGKHSSHRDTSCKAHRTFAFLHFFTGTSRHSQGVQFFFTLLDSDRIQETKNHLLQLCLVEQKQTELDSGRRKENFRESRHRVQN